MQFASAPQPGAGGAGPGARPMPVAPSMASVLGCDVTMFLSFAGLRSADVFTKSDPYATVELHRPFKQKSGGGSGWVQVGATTHMSNVDTGSWAENFSLRYLFEEQQTVRVRVFDYDKHSKHEFLGEAVFHLGNVMGAPGQRQKVGLVKAGDATATAKGGKAKDRGCIIVNAEKSAAQGRGSLTFRLAASKLDSKDWGGLRASDPYFVLQRQIPGSDNWVSVHKSEWIKKTSSPRWAQATVELGKLCRGNLDEPIRVRVMDWDKGTQHDLIGDATVTVRQLVAAASSPSQQAFDVVHPPTKKKYQKASYKNSGQLHVLAAATAKAPIDGMLDFLAGGLQIQLVVGVDFTASNGNPTSGNSLHHRSPQKLNAYQSAIASVGDILQAYDADGQIAALGFGGQYKGSVSHCFPLNGNDEEPEVAGVGGVMQAYEAALANVRLSGPTYFAPLLEAVQGLARAPEMSQQAQSYTILLLLTDGEILDMQQTVDALVAASKMPMSVVIVGVGSADFSKMERLDGDDEALVSSRGERAARDIVQFVEYAKCRNDGDLLAKETLAEVPEQIVQYFASKKIKPNPPLRAPSTLAAVQSVALEGGIYPVLPPTAPGAAVASPSLMQQQKQLATSGRDLLVQAFHL